MGEEGVYFIRVSRCLNDDWRLSVGDFVGYCEANELSSPLSTPKIFDEAADDRFHVVSHYDLLIDEGNDPVHDPEVLQEYMNKWDGPAFIEEMQLNNQKSVLEIGVGTGRLVLSIDKNPSEFIDTGIRKIKIYPDTAEIIIRCIEKIEAEAGNSADVK